MQTMGANRRSITKSKMAYINYKIIYLIDKNSERIIVPTLLR